LQIEWGRQRLVVAPHFASDLFAAEDFVDGGLDAAFRLKVTRFLPENLVVLVGDHHAVDVEAILLDAPQAFVVLAVGDRELHLAFVLRCEPIHDGNDFAAKWSTSEVEVGQRQAVGRCRGRLGGLLSDVRLPRDDSVGVDSVGIDSLGISFYRFCLAGLLLVGTRNFGGFAVAACNQHEAEHHGHGGFDHASRLANERICPEGDSGGTGTFRPMDWVLAKVESRLVA